METFISAQLTNVRKEMMFMNKMGISLYPQHSTPEKDDAYMALAARYGFKRIFTCLLSGKGEREEIISTFTDFMDRAHRYQFEVAVDTNPEIFSKLGATPFDLKPFADMGVDIIRLDGHFGSTEDVAITRNPYHIAVEFNSSQNMDLELLLERGADRHNMITCHNFYPQRYTGMGFERFRYLAGKYKKAGFRTAAFVSSHNENTFGPWPVSEGLPTCEMHRDLPIDLQMRHLLATGLIDDIIIGNCFATEDELCAMAQVDKSRITMKMNLADGVTDLEKSIVSQYRHFNRVDASDYMIRSSLPRLSCREVSIPPRVENRSHFTRGDVLVVNDNLAHYRGELEVVLQDIPNDGQRNRIGTITKAEQILLHMILPEYEFGFILN